MGWKDYFAKGFGGTKDGSTYLGLDATTDEEFGMTDEYVKNTPSCFYTVTTTTRARPTYHAARPGKRWKK